jgi:uncharacterized YigZ family protein
MDENIWNSVCCIINCTFVHRYLTDTLEYKTIKSTAKGFYREKGSKFHAYLFPVNHINIIKKLLEESRGLHPKARHHCFAYRIGSVGQEHRASDDGEPGGSAGLPIYNQLLSSELTNVLCIVVRYFGGTKLGIPGLINAYKTVTVEAVTNATIIRKERSVVYELSSNYIYAYKLIENCKKEGIEFLSKSFEDSAIYHVRMNAEEHEKQIEHIIRTTLGIYETDEIPENDIKYNLTFEEK